MRRARKLVELRLDGLADFDDAFDARAVRKYESEVARLLVPFRADTHHRSVPLACVQRAVLVAQPEAAIAAHATGLELHLFRVDEAERLDRRDRDANDPSSHAFRLEEEVAPRRPPVVGA